MEINEKKTTELTVHRIRAMSCLVHLQQLALHGTNTSYESLAIALGLPNRGNALGAVLSPILLSVLEWCHANHWPNLTVLVVRKSGATRGMPGAGFWSAMDMSKTTVQERRELTRKWSEECFAFFDNFAV